MFHGKWYEKGKKEVSCTKCGLKLIINIYDFAKPCPRCGNRNFKEVKENEY